VLGRLNYIGIIQEDSGKVVHNFKLGHHMSTVTGNSFSCWVQLSSYCLMLSLEDRNRNQVILCYMPLSEPCRIDMSFYPNFKVDFLISLVLEL
jgi:hypothetical protein